MSISQLSTLSIKYYIKIIQSLYLIQIVKELIISSKKEQNNRTKTSQKETLFLSSYESRDGGRTRT